MTMLTADMSVAKLVHTVSRAQSNQAPEGQTHKVKSIFERARATLVEVKTKAQAKFAEVKNSLLGRIQKLRSKSTPVPKTNTPVSAHVDSELAKLSSDKKALEEALKKAEIAFQEKKESRQALIDERAKMYEQDIFDAKENVFKAKLASSNPLSAEEQNDKELVAACEAIDKECMEDLKLHAKGAAKKEANALATKVVDGSLAKDQAQFEEFQASTKQKIKELSDQIEFVEREQKLEIPVYEFLGRREIEQAQERLLGHILAQEKATFQMKGFTMPSKETVVTAKEEAVEALPASSSAVQARGVSKTAVCANIMFQGALVGTALLATRPELRKSLKENFSLMMSNQVMPFVAKQFSSLKQGIPRGLSLKTSGLPTDTVANHTLQRLLQSKMLPFTFNGFRGVDSKERASAKFVKDGLTQVSELYNQVLKSYMARRNPSIDPAALVATAIPEIEVVVFKPLD